MQGASLLPYTPADLTFTFIGDSLSAVSSFLIVFAYRSTSLNQYVRLKGQFLPKGVDQAWPFLVGEAFKAEHVVVAQPGAALSVRVLPVPSLLLVYFKLPMPFLFQTGHRVVREHARRVVPVLPGSFVLLLYFIIWRTCLIAHVHIDGRHRLFLHDGP
jgi:hypothetical protein